MEAEYFAQSGADFSDCGAYRYRLWRRWGGGGKVTFIMLNPSTADATRNDPTIERCHRRAVAMGFSALDVVNIFAFRATDPRDLKRTAKPVGSDNDAAIIASLKDADMTICAWGSHGDHQNRHNAVRDLLKANRLTVHALSLTKKGLPGHPLYLSYRKEPFVWAEI
ncbi:MAG: hypothetical protein COB93_03365 [Sneathiella sp.]|nr:MAG: hypothetical protein COB93_03365 [Sneathiella sp.]